MKRPPPWRWFIELGSSNHDSPLFLAERGERLEWQPAWDAAKSFTFHHDAWDFVLANGLPASRITCR